MMASNVRRNELMETSSRQVGRADRQVADTGGGGRKTAAILYPK
jgi:hypothetical protein